MSDQKKCIVCAMPLVKDEDYPAGDITKDYCKHCGTEEGLHSYKDLVSGMAGFMQKSKGMEEEQAKQAAKQAVDNSEAVKSGALEV